jgi:hypothetical protein
MGFREQGSGMMAETTSRVPKHTPEHLNRKIIDKTINNILTHGISGPQIESRLKALDREWDIERLLQANASSLVVIGVLLGVFANHWFYLVPFLVGIFLLSVRFRDGVRRSVSSDGLDSELVRKLPQNTMHCVFFAAISIT